MNHCLNHAKMVLQYQPTFLNAVVALFKHYVELKDALGQNLLNIVQGS